MSAASDLLSQIEGTWLLQEYRWKRADNGDVIYPMGREAKGTLVYRADGNMSVEIMPRDRESASDSDEPSLNDLIQYSGPYDLDCVRTSCRYAPLGGVLISCHSGHHSAATDSFLF